MFPEGPLHLRVTDQHGRVVVDCHKVAVTKARTDLSSGETTLEMRLLAPTTPAPKRKAARATKRRR